MERSSHRLSLHRRGVPLELQSPTTLSHDAQQQFLDSRTYRSFFPATMAGDSSTPRSLIERSPSKAGSSSQRT